MGEVSLERVLERAGGLGVPLGCWLIARAAEALASAPRAITPSEVRIGERGEVHIAPPRPGRTPFEYLAPEVVRGGEPDERSAVFGLGALLVTAITGRSPFARDGDLATRLAVMEDAPPALHGRVADASRELDAIVQRAVAKDPAARFATMAELAARIDAFLADELHDASADALAAAVAAAMGRDAGARSRGFDPPELLAPLGTPGVARSALRRPTPPPDALEPAGRRESTPAPAIVGAVGRSKSTPAPGLVEPVGRIRPTPGLAEPAVRSKSTPAPGLVEPAVRSKLTPAPGLVEPVVRSKPTPAPGTVAPAASRPADLREPPMRASPAPGAASAPGPHFEDAELDLSRPARRLSHPAKPKLDHEVVRLGDPLDLDAGAGVTDAVLVGPRRTPRSGPAPLLLVDESAMRPERLRPPVVREEPEAPAPAGPNWMKRIVLFLFALVALALVYQFVMRPLLG